MPWPISTMGITSVTAPARSMRMKAFGAKLDGCCAAAADPGLNSDGIPTLSTKPPTLAPIFRNSRRSSCGADALSLMVSSCSRARGSVNRRANALICSAPADVAGHSGVDIGIARFRGGY
jgi:hypothetical protein